ncbi:MAG: Hsp20/alpha crystallin family protein, partial [Deltaproteobacteria bacterium]|nr:Hsp20/alpha crystallin family protein [Deltaproteobacteria bacterium]
MEQNNSSSARRAFPERTSVPPADIFETKEGIELLLDLPGVKDEGLDINFEKNTLSITAKVFAAAKEGYQLGHGERPADVFKRSFALSKDLNVDKAEASLKDGVLKIS